MCSCVFRVGVRAQWPGNARLPHLCCPLRGGAVGVGGYPMHGIDGPMGRDAFITPAAWGLPYASEGGTKSEVSHKWAG